MDQPASVYHARYTSNQNIYNDPTRFWQHDSKHSVYLIIDLKSFYASVECVERGLDPMTTNLVVADPERSQGTLCLAVSPSLKKLGVRNRCRIYEIPDTISYITAPPQMQHYIDCSAEIYEVYLQYIAREDIHIYSIDEVFMNITGYLDLYQMTPKELGIEIMNAILDKTGIRSTCGIGTNMYLAKVALDIVSKHAPDFIGILDEDRYRALLWNHRPLTDFWMVAGGTSSHLQRLGIMTMGQLAQTATVNPALLYKEFGINAEILIDHAFGKEPVSISDVRNYRIKTKSLSSGQVLLRDYAFDEGEIVLTEMIDKLCLQMAEKEVVTNSITLYVVYSHSWADYNGFPAAPSKGTVRSDNMTHSDEIWRDLVRQKYEEVVRRDAPIRIIGLCCNRVKREADAAFQYSLFDEKGNFWLDIEKNLQNQDRNRQLQKTVISIKNRYGKNAVMKATSLEKAGTMMERNCQIGGHKAGRSVANGGNRSE